MSKRPDNKIKSTRHLATRHTVLIGMMGSGKSSVGSILADRLGCPFYCTDSLIEAREGQSVGGIFTTKNETYFRHIEAEVIREVAQDKYGIISLGGGGYMFEGSRKILREYGAVVIWLRASVGTLVARLSSSSIERPLLRGDNITETLGNLLEARTPTYSLANMHVSTDNYTIDELSEEILRRLDDYQESPGVQA